MGDGRELENELASLAAPPEPAERDALADEVQSLLDADRREMEAAGPGPGPEAASVGQAGDALDTSFEAPGDDPVSGGAVGEEAVPTLEQLDEAIAAGADEAVAGAFETVDDVLGGEVAIEPIVATIAPETTAAAVPPVSVHEDVQLEVDEVELAGDFASPDELLSESPDVAAESVAVEEPIHLRLPTEAPAEPEAEPEKPVGLPGLLWPVLGPVMVAGQALRPLVFQVLRLLNRPLDLLPAEARPLVGYAGLITLFNALCLILYGLIG